MSALVVVHHQDRASLAGLPYAAAPGSIWLLDGLTVRVLASGRVERLGRSR